MTEFKIGDQVNIIRVNSRATHPEGVFELTKFCLPSDSFGTTMCGDGFSISWYKFELINNKTMNIKEKFVTVFLSEPEKSFRKTGITNGDGLLTEDGKTVFLSYLLKKYGDDFKATIVDELLKQKDQ